MSDTFVERFASVLYESDEFLESWSDARDADRDEYLAIARREVSVLLADHAHELAEKIRQGQADREATPGEHYWETHQGAHWAAGLIDPEATV